MDRKKSGRLRLAGIVLGVIALALLIAAAVDLAGQEPPKLAEDPPVFPDDPPLLLEGPAAEEPVEEPGEEAGAEPGEEAVPAVARVGGERSRQVYTLLLVGSDDGNGNTDTIIVARLDAAAHTLRFVSIPRDTLANIDMRNTRRINAVYAGVKNSGGDGIEGLKQEIRKLTGFTVDCYLLIDLRVFIEAIDLIGGVDFDVPQAMHYDDDAQDLHIHLEPGPQRLSGEQAMGLVRFRSGYPNADLGRVDMQQRFLRAAAAQFISLGTVPHLGELTKLLAENTETDLSDSNIRYLARQLLLCRSEDIRAATMPVRPITVRGASYVLVELEPWLEMVNEYLNPYTEPVTRENVDIVTLDASGFHATGGKLRGAWFFD
ncbi:MAG: LCP family protein [Oscillospiraceae bacterium]|nr:LCP family protein [Oscillospiraceae bacterium]